MLEHEPPGAARTPSTPPDGAASPSQKFYSIPTPTSEHSAIPGLRAAAASFSWLGRGSGGAGGTGGAGDSYQEEGSSESDEVLGSEYYPFRPASHGARAEHDLYGGGGSPQRNHDDSMDADLSDLLSRAKVFDNLRSENLRSENLHSENLRSENLRSENLRSENLRAENLRSENLRSDNLRADNLRTENLRSENLRAENLRSDHLRAQHRSSSTRNFNEPHIETRGSRWATGADNEPPEPLARAFSEGFLHDRFASSDFSSARRSTAGEQPGHVQWEAASFRGFAKEDPFFVSIPSTPVLDFANVGLNIDGGGTARGASPGGWQSAGSGGGRRSGGMRSEFTPAGLFTPRGGNEAGDAGADILPDAAGQKAKDAASRWQGNDLGGRGSVPGVKSRARGGAGLVGGKASSVYEFRCKELEVRLQSVEKEASAYADRLADMHDVVKGSADEAEEGRRREHQLKAQVQRLQMEVRRNASSRGALEELFTAGQQQLRVARSERDVLAEQLGLCAEEILVRDGALADSAVFMQELKRRNVQLQSNLHDLLVRIGENRAVPDSPKDEGVFGLEHIRDKIEQAVRDASALPESERKDTLKALRLRWHPDKNSVLQEFATEVTKIINEAVDRHA